MCLVAVREDAMEIALCLSGGGYRAAAFQLGVLRALQRLSLLDDVKRVSTASGGTIVAARWLAGLSRHETFDVFDVAMQKFLVDTNVVQRALDRLSTSASPSLICEAANVYDELLDGLRWPQLERGRFAEIVFNATDFHSGNAFRFVKSDNALVEIGNAGYHLKDAELGTMRVADAVAASSCFPGAFEPIVFPTDFAGVVVNPKAVSVPLMDGGIYDNQATSSLLLAYGRARPPALDLMIVADTDQHGDVYNTKSARAVPFGRFRLRTAYLFLGLVALVVAMAAAAGVVGVVVGPRWWHRAIAASATLGCGGFAGIFVVLRAALWPKLMALVPYENAAVWRAIKDVRINHIFNMVSLRADSVLALTARAFMGRIRGMTYSRLFSVQALQGKVCAVQIYALAQHDNVKVRALALRAQATPTALWMQPTQMNDAIACGELTTYAALAQLDGCAAAARVDAAARFAALAAALT